MSQSIIPRSTTRWSQGAPLLGASPAQRQLPDISESARMGTQKVLARKTGVSTINNSQWISITSDNFPGVKSMKFGASEWIPLRKCFKVHMQLGSISVYVLYIYTYTYMGYPGFWLFMGIVQVELFFSSQPHCNWDYAICSEGSYPQLSLGYGKSRIYYPQDSPG